MYFYDCFNLSASQTVIFYKNYFEYFEDYKLNKKYFFSVTVQMEDVVLTQTTDKLQSEIIMQCTPMLEHVLEPTSIELEVAWYVNDELVLTDTFLASAKLSSQLPQKHWRPGTIVSLFPIIFLNNM